jgi:16S rRNA C1402 (ribose-2'-O) methylase RsmI
VRGEVVFLLEGGTAAPASNDAAEALARSLLADGFSASAAARELARRLQLRRNQAYQVIHGVSGKQEKAQ